jgi:pimeloyl-ACP methyl ester carboxylesterase
LGVIGLIATVLAVVTHPVVGTFYPGEPDRTPVVAWGGSGGGQPDAVARDLAAHGHPAFALTFFGEPGLPPHLESIPLEYFARAVREFDRRPGVDGSRTVVYGHSRGSESALLVGSLYPELVHGVIATAPSNKSYGSSYRSGPGWTLRGRPLPVAVFDDPTAGYDRKALIEVERIRGPVLLGSGAEDQLYDSKAYARAIVRRLHRRRFRFPVRSVVFADTGHEVAEPMQPIILRFLDAGERRRRGG